MTTGDAYREGLAYGHRIAYAMAITGPKPRYNMAQSLRLEVQLAGSNKLKRARALGELRGYRSWNA
jgi:hypothetical protein